MWTTTAPHVISVQQKAYDYPRLLECSLKFMSPELMDGCGEAIELVEQCADEATKEADIDPSRPTLARVRAKPRLHGAILALSSG